MSEPIKPKMIRLEASSACQLKCPSCPTADQSILPTIGAGFLRFKNFKKIIDENPWLKKIELSNYGEIFLNPQLPDIMQYAHEHKVALIADNGVNLNHVREEVLEGLVKYQFQSMTVSIDGASDGTYERYRVKGNYGVVIDNIKKINQFKAHYQSNYPVLSWQFIVFGYNQHELPAAKALAKELNLKFRSKLSWDPEFSPVTDKGAAAAELGAATREDYKEKFGIDYGRGICHQLWKEPQINWDGKILGCCRNFWGDFGGNAFTDGLLDSLNNDKINYARDMLQGRQPARDDIPCTTCDLYLDLQATGNWLDVPSNQPEALIPRIKRAIKTRLPSLFGQA